MKHRFLVLDIFRGIFASLVVFYHMSAFSDTPILNNSLIMNGDMFVDFFFVLSGFVICYSYQKIENFADVKTFMTKRLIRLYPLHLVLLILFVFLEFSKIVLKNYVHINNTLDNTPTTFVTSFFLINSIKFPGVRDLSWNMVSWSISAELISYILFSLVCYILSILRLDKLKIIIYSLISLFAIYILYNITNSYKLDYSYNYGFLRGIIGFFAGAVCLYCFQYFYEKFKGFGLMIFSALEIISLIIIVFAIVNGEILKPIGYVYEIIFFISIFIFAFENGIISKELNKILILKNIGKYSYSIYMLHTLFISMFNVVFIRIFKLPPTAYWYLFILNYLVIYFAANWTYKNIEMRFQTKKIK